MKNPVGFTFLLCTSCFVIPILAFIIGSFIVSFVNWDYHCDQEIVSMAGLLLAGASLNTIYLFLGLLILYIFYQCGQTGHKRLCSWWLFMVMNTIFTILFLLDGGLEIYFVFYENMYTCLQGYEALWVFTIMLIVVDFINVISSICMCFVYKSFFNKSTYMEIN
jgi:hypothetical protein